MHTPSPVLVRSMLGFMLLLSLQRSDSHSLSSPFAHSQLESCCGGKIDNVKLEDPSTLLSCVQRSSRIHQDQVMKWNQKSHWPLLNVGLVTYATEDIWNYSSYSFAVNEFYAEHNGYVMVSKDGKDHTPESDPRWNKIQILLEALDEEEGWGRDLDYLLWIDADAIFLDLNFRLEQIAAEYPKAHLLISAENAGSTSLVNTGTILVRNTRWSRQFLREWWEYGPRPLYSDQEQFDLLYQSHLKELRLQQQQVIVILPPDALNSDPPAMTRQKPENKVLHLMGEHSHYRQKIFQIAFHELCSKTFHNIPSSTSSSVAIAPQLTLTAENLRLWAIESYGAEVIQRMADYRRTVSRGLNDMKASRLLSNAVHHYATAIEFQQQQQHGTVPTGAAEEKEERKGEEKYREATALRNETFFLLLQNLNHRRFLNDEYRESHGGVPMSDWLELIKTVCEAGQALLGRGSIAERRVVGEILMSLMEELLSQCHPLQRAAILQMIATLQKDLGVILYADRKISEALKQFQKSLQLSLQLAERSGEHILAIPLSLMGNCYAILGRYGEAFESFQRAIEITERHLGPSHDSLCEMLFNFATAKHLSGSSSQTSSASESCSGSAKEAKDLIDRALVILLQSANREDGSGTLKSPLYQRVTQLHHIISEACVPAAAAAAVASVAL